VAQFTYSTQPRGGVLHALALCEALDRTGHRATLFAADLPGARFVREPACEAIVAHAEPHDGSLYDFVVRRSDALVRAVEARDARYDVYHAHDGMSALALLRLVERGRIAGYFRTVHHLNVHADARLEAIERRTIAGARGIFVVSERWRGVLRERFGIAAHLAGNGVDTHRFFPRTGEARGPVGPRFLTIGGIEDRKNTLALLDAFVRVKQQLPGAHLTIAGGASVLDHTAYRRAFDTRLASSPLRAGDDYEILGVVSDATLVARIREADAFVFPSLVEGFGLVVLEALACGTPVVVSGIPPFVDYLQASDAIFVDPHVPESIAAGMLAALEPAASQALRARGPHVAASFSWERVAASYVGGYRA
jgi:glycosyltransferase-like protein